jgi:hypothetical protein
MASFIAPQSWVHLVRSILNCGDRRIGFNVIGQIVNL